jgi:hypothetical protein
MHVIDTIPQGHVWPKIILKIDAKFFGFLFIYNYLIYKKKNW